MVEGHHVDGQLLFAGADKFAYSRHLIVENAVNLIFQTMLLIWIVYIACQHRVKDNILHFDAAKRKYIELIFGILSHFPYGRVLQKRL
ncbi:MAG: hypothetical protein BWY75_03257 [bacterium ADurb.Bin425]|nr:MAG: hypothetical protein BWY75_03257 [bacterium ADurb.Bin425]